MLILQNMALAVRTVTVWLWRVKARLTPSCGGLCSMWKNKGWRKGQSRACEVHFREVAWGRAFIQLVRLYRPCFLKKRELGDHFKDACTSMAAWSQLSALPRLPSREASQWFRSANYDSSCIHQVCCFASPVASLAWAPWNFLPHATTGFHYNCTVLGK